MSRPAGVVLRALAEWICEADAIERVIDPTLADFRLEHEEATRRGHHWRSRRLRVAVSIALIAAVVMCTRDRLWRIVTAPRTGDEGTLAPTLIASSVAALAALMLFVLPLLSIFDRIHWRIVLYAIPQAVPLAIPVGLTVGVLASLRRARASTRVNAQLLAIAIGCSVPSSVALAWIVPGANQAFRELAFRQISPDPPGASQPRRPLARGVNELTVGELKQQMRASSPGDPVAPIVPFVYYQRWALASATAVMMLFALATIARWPIGRIGGLAVAVGSCVAYALLADVGRRHAVSGAWPSVLAAWLPNSCFAAFALLLSLLNVRAKRRGDRVGAPA
jgi:hypothetical protein